MQVIHCEILRHELVNQCVRKLSFIADSLAYMDRVPYAILLRDLIGKIMSFTPLTGHEFYHYCYGSSKATMPRTQHIICLCRLCDALIYTMHELDQRCIAMLMAQYKVPLIRKTIFVPAFYDIVRFTKNGGYDVSKRIECHRKLHDNPSEFWSIGEEFGLLKIIDAGRSRGNVPNTTRNVVAEVRKIACLPVPVVSMHINSFQIFQGKIGTFAKHVERLRITHPDAHDYSRAQARAHAYASKLAVLLNPIYTFEEFDELREMYRALMDKYKMFSKQN